MNSGMQDIGGVLADEQPGWRPEEYAYEMLDYRMQFAFPVVKLLDMQDDLDQLLKSGNAFALVTAAHMLTRQTRGNPGHRYEPKLRLIRILFTRGWECQRILSARPEQVEDWALRVLDGKSVEDVLTVNESKDGYCGERDGRS